MDFRELFHRLSSTPSMFLPDDRYATLVAFIEGCNAGTDWKLLDGFNPWLQEQLRGAGFRSSIHWSGIIAHHVAPRAGDSGQRVLESTKEIEAEAKNLLLARLDEFLEWSAKPGI